MNKLLMSTQTVENGVPIMGNFPIGAFAIVPFETFFDINRTMRHTMLQSYVCQANKILVVLF